MQQIILQMLPGLLTSLVTALAGAVAGFALGHRKAAENKDKAMESGVKESPAARAGNVFGLALYQQGRYSALWYGNPAQLL